MNNRSRVIKKIVIILVIVLFVSGIIIINKNLIKKETEIALNPEIVGYTITIDLNGADKVDKKKISCISENNNCYVTLPNAIRKNGTVLGFSKNPDDIIPEYLIGTKISIEDNMKLYVISEKENIVYIENNDVDYLEKNIIKCTSYNKENKCKVKMPLFNKKGYENRGYSTSSSSLVGFVFPNEDYVISKDVTLYPIYGINNHMKKIMIDKTYTYLDSTIEVEEGCTNDVYNAFLNYLKEISYNAPFLLIGNKISFITDDSFDYIWGKNYVGMNYGPRNLRAVDIRCGTRLVNDYYGTMVHEMSHSWDFYYATKIGNNISSENDIINLYNKYSNMKIRPFREYSYSNIYEFLADMMKYYYFKYIMKNEKYVNSEYPSDIKKAIEKYICISNNNYDKNKCNL